MKGRKLHNHSHVQLCQGGVGDAALHLTVRESGEAKMVAKNAEPETSWEVHLSKKNSPKGNIRSGSIIALEAVQFAGPSFFCCNNNDQKAHMTSDLAAGLDYGWAIHAVDDKKYIRFNEPFYLKAKSGGFLQNVKEGANFQHGDKGPAAEWHFSRVDWQEDDSDAHDGRKVRSGDCIQLSFKGQALHSSIEASGKAKYGDLDAKIESGWRIIDAAGKKYLRDGDPVFLVSMDTSCGPRNRMFCSNCEAGGASWLEGPLGEDTVKHGWTIRSYEGSRVIHYGESVALEGNTNKKFLQSGKDGEAFVLSEVMDNETRWDLTHSTEHTQAYTSTSSSNDEAAGAKARNHMTVMLLPVEAESLEGALFGNNNGKALLSNMGENDGLSLGEPGKQPDAQWEIVCGDGSDVIASGSRVTFAALDTSKGPQGRYLCSNAVDRGASFTEDFETACNYGWDIISAAKKDVIQIGDPVYLKAASEGVTGVLKSDGDNGDNFTFGDAGEDDGPGLFSGGTQWRLGEVPSKTD